MSQPLPTEHAPGGTGLTSGIDHSTQIKNLQLYTQYRIKADMGQLLKSQGVVAPLASVVQNEVKTKVNLPGMN